MNTYLLAIESSCDDTSCAVLCNDKVLSNVTANQEIHRQYGGVVPELASRDHQKNIVPVVDAAIKKAGIQLSQLSAIGVTSGPGLMGSLLVGLSFAKSLSLALNIPLVEVNHMQGHILAHFIKDESNEAPQFPFLCLTVSGGHTQIIKVSGHLNFEIIGQTLDDAVGEAFDKAAKILGLPYPGGPLIDKYAKEGDKNKYKFPVTHLPGYDYSFSGIKTSFLYFIQNNVQKNENFVRDNLNDICASYQHHLITVLLKNVKKALADTAITQLAIAGGVSANSELREQVKALENGCQFERSREHPLCIKTYIPPFEYCTDNAAMIGITAYYKFLNKEFSELSVVPQTRMGI
ncbi:MAG: tRNA (adenosine(37)-N6)-threonylcarbamoyltransferase complex transferase subunit TsaD [Bacteroidia bacterium]